MFAQKVYVKCCPGKYFECLRGGVFLVGSGLINICTCRIDLLPAASFSPNPLDPSATSLGRVVVWGQTGSHGTSCRGTAQREKYTSEPGEHVALSTLIWPSQDILSTLGIKALSQLGQGQRFRPGGLAPLLPRFYL